MAGYKPQPKWMMKIKVGDVLRAASGLERVVRDVSFRISRGEQRMHMVTFTIKHCSWTGRCHTHYDQAGLTQFGYKPTGVNVSLRTRLDRRIAREVKNHGRREMSCCDVRGIA